MSSISKYLMLSSVKISPLLQNVQSAALPPLHTRARVHTHTHTHTHTHNDDISLQLVTYFRKSEYVYEIVVTLLVCSSLVVHTI
jgi:hypothetical protein